MNKNLTLRLIAFFFGLLSLSTFIACSDDDEIIEDKPITLPNSGYGEDNWIYFSFSKGAIVEGINESNRGNDLTWDIAFYRYNIRTNGGLSGKGKGGAFDTGKTELSQVSTIPTGEFTTDEMGEVTANMSSFPPPTMKTPLNKLLGKAIEFQGPPPTYTPNNHVYVVKTADGKYVKIKFLGFYNDEGESGHMNFKYEFLSK